MEFEESLNQVGVPRTRGDDPIRWRVVFGSTMCSPHTRG